MIAFAAQSPTISLMAQPIFSIGPVTITNSMLLGLVGTITFFWLLLYTRRHTLKRRHTLLSIAILWIFEILIQTAEEVLGSRQRARQVAPLAITMFFFILINNWLEVLPIVGPVSLHGHQLFRGLAADLNFTFSLAFITFIATQLWAIKSRGIVGNLRRYVANPLRNPLQAFEGLLELVAECSRTIALSMRLFGNIFGGEVLLLVIAFITSWAAPVALPVFLVLELFVGAIQAYIFFMLTITFISLGSKSPAAEHTTPRPLVMGPALAGGAGN